MSSKEETETSEFMLDLLEDLKIITKNKLVEMPDIDFTIVMFDRKTGIYGSDGTLCTICAKEMLEDEIEFRKLKHK